jgi:hypothetical protein
MASVAAVHLRPSLPRLALSALALAVLAATLVAAAPASAAKRFYIERGFVMVALNNSAWSLGNGVRASDCTGTGPARRDAAYQSTYASFQCTVVDDTGGARGVALVEPIGPEAVRVARAISGDPPPDRPIGAIPRGSRRIRSSEVAALLQRSTWAKSHPYAYAVCYGVGPFDAVKGINVAGAYFSAFVCKTNAPAGTPAVVLVATSGKKAVRVVRELAVRPPPPAG